MVPFLGGRHVHFRGFSKDFVGSTFPFPLLLESKFLKVIAIPGIVGVTIQNGGWKTTFLFRGYCLGLDVCKTPIRQASAVPKRVEQPPVKSVMT